MTEALKRKTADKGKKQIIVPASPSCLNAVQNFLEETLTEYGLSKKDICIFLIASDEVFSNVCRYSKAKEAAVECSVQGNSENGRIVLKIEDDGTAFDPLEKPVPDVESPLEHRKQGGLGIYMVRKLMDAVTYRRIDGKNSLLMAKKVKRERK